MVTGPPIVVIVRNQPLLLHSKHIFTLHKRVIQILYESLLIRMGCPTELWGVKPAEVTD